MSAHLRHLSSSLREPIALGELLGRMRQAGFGLTLLFLSVPFLQPLPTAGLSTPLGLVLLLLGVQIMMRRDSVWLPRFLAARVLDTRLSSAALNASGRIMESAERLLCPRLSWLAGAQWLLGGMVAIMAALLMLPLPVPLSNVVCALPITLFGLAILTRDGLAAVLGLGASLIGIAYFAAIFLFGFSALQRLLGWLA